MKKLLAFCLLLLTAATAQAQNLYVGSFNGGTVAKYDAATGAAAPGFDATGYGQTFQLALSGNTLFIADPGSGTVQARDAATGAAVPGFTGPTDAVSAYGVAAGGSTLFISDSTGNTIGAYDATTGATINANFVTGLNNNHGLALSGGTLYVANGTNVLAYNATTGAVVSGFNFAGPAGETNLFNLTVANGLLYVSFQNSGNVGVYNATTGDTINAALISSGADAQGIAVSGNTLYLASFGANRVAAYDAATGALIDPALVSVDTAVGLVVGVPEPGTWALLSLGGAGMMTVIGRMSRRQAGRRA